jgi:hypothetical protein
MVAGSMTAVTEGTANADTLWKLATNGTITLNTTSLSFSQIGNPNATTLGGFPASYFKPMPTVVTIASLTTNYSAAANSIILVKLTAAATANIVFPTGTAAGTTVTIKDASENFATYNVTAQRGGSDTIENSTSFVLNISKMSVTFCSDGAGGWWII